MYFGVGKTDLTYFEASMKELVSNFAIFFSANVKATLMEKVQAPMANAGHKVTVVGVGQVGMACAFSILSQVKHSLPTKVKLQL